MSVCIMCFAPTPNPSPEGRCPDCQTFKERLDAAQERGEYELRKQNTAGALTITNADQDEGNLTLAEGHIPDNT